MRAQRVPIGPRDHRRQPAPLCRRHLHLSKRAESKGCATLLVSCIPNCFAASVRLLRVVVDAVVVEDDGVHMVVQEAKVTGSAQIGGDCYVVSANIVIKLPKTFCLLFIKGQINDG